MYSLGAILYELLTGQPPFRAETPMETLMRVIEREPEKPRSLNPRVDRDLETICLKCLEKESQRRYSSAEALAEDLERWLHGEPILARPSTAFERAVKWVKRRPVTAGLTAAVAASLVTGMIVSSYFAIEANQQAVRAEDERDRAEANARQATEERNRADQETEQAKDNLVRSLYEQARALRASGQVGHRALALELLQEAATLSDRQRKGPLSQSPAPGARSTELPTKAELRTAAVASLLSADARLLREMKAPNPALSANGRFAAGTWAKSDFQAILQGKKAASIPQGLWIMETTASAAQRKPYPMVRWPTG